VSTACNGEKEITVGQWLPDSAWQEKLRLVFKPGLAETIDAQAYEAIYAALLEQLLYQIKSDTYPEDAEDSGHPKAAWSKFLHFRDIVNNKSLYRKYSRLVGGIRTLMVDEGILIRVRTVEKDEKGREKKGKQTPFILRSTEKITVLF
jgi:hypothetical protein